MRTVSSLPTLTRYRNRSGDSGVVAFALLDDGIIVQFRGGATYLYGPRRPGQYHVGKMKSLAIAGRGLSTYISRYVRDKYEEQLDAGEPPARDGGVA